MISKEERLGRRRRRYRENVRDRREEGRRYYQEHKEERCEYARKHRALNPQQYREYSRKKNQKYKVRRNRSTLESAYKRAYGITIADKELMLQAQGGMCAACGTDDPKSKKGWHVDHCHESKIVRGILCQPCNLALGHVKDRSDHLRQLITYLEKWGQ